MKYRIYTVALMVACLFFGGCKSITPPKEIQAAGEIQELEIGISFDSFVIERWIRDRDVFVSTAKNLGAKVNVQNANGDIEEQISQIEFFISRHVDVIVVVAGDYSQLTDVMKRAKDAGIKTMCYDRLIANADCDLYVSFDNEKVGVLMAEALVDAIPEGGDIFMIKGSQGDYNVEQIDTGFYQVLKHSNLNVVYEVNCDGWLAEPAFDYVKEAVRLYSNVKGIMCGNDDIATQVFRALSEEQLAGTVKIVGQDGDLMACQRIVEGTQQMTAFKYLDEEAALAAQYAVMLGRGESLLAVDQWLNDGTYDVPYLELKPISVTRENMDETIISGGFHSREEVYLNVK